MRLTSGIAQKTVDKDGVVTLLLSTVLICLTLGVSWLWMSRRTYLTAKKAPSTGDAQIPLIVFGKQLVQNQIDTDYQLRLERTLDAVRHTPNVSIILLGGTTDDNLLSESEVGQRYLITQQPELETHLILEKSSRNTLENLQQAKQYLLAQQYSLHVRLLSNRYHLYRCKLIATGLGLKADLIAAETEFVLSWPQSYKIIIEGFLNHWYHTGAFISRLFNNQRMLSKIE